eukprot:3669125-Pyramimonas_sp.AAC.1
MSAIGGQIGFQSCIRHRIGVVTGRYAHERGVLRPCPDALSGPAPLWHGTPRPSHPSRCLADCCQSRSAMPRAFVPGSGHQQT